MAGYRTVVAWGAILIGLAACSGEPETLLGAPAHHTPTGFTNPHIAEPNKNFLSFMAMKYFGDTTWADHRAGADQVPVRDLDLALVLNPPGPQISWLGHSTFLIQIGGLNILTDPIFGDRASPFGFTGPQRYVRHVVDYAALPKIDYVVISHNHYDHLDATAVEILGNDPVYLAPLKLTAWFVDHGVAAARILEFDWWQERAVAGMRVQATPSQHWSVRGPFDRHETLWASWVLEVAGRRFWFAGDTGYNDVQFRDIGRRAGPFDLALIPVGGYAPRDFMKAYHVNPAEAVQIHRDIGARRSIGMHWGTFPLTAEAPLTPLVDLAVQRRAAGLADGEFDTMDVGETRAIPSLTAGP